MPTTDIVSGIADPNIIWVNADAGDDDWKGTFNQPVATVTAAMALVSATRKIIMVLPCLAGEYDEAAAVSWSTLSGVKLIFLPGAEWTTVLKSSASVTNVINMAPGVQTSTWEAYIVGCYLEVEDGYDGIGIVHTDVDKKMNVYFENFGSDCASDDEVIKVTHGGDGNAVRLYFSGGSNGDIEGIVYHQFTDAGDRIHADNCRFVGGFNIGTAAKAAELILRHCLLKHEGVTGGHATQVLIAVGSYSVTSNTYAIIDDSDITETVSWDTVLPAS